MSKNNCNKEHKKSHFIDFSNVCDLDLDLKEFFLNTHRLLGKLVIVQHLLQVINSFADRQTGNHLNDTRFFGRYTHSFHGIASKTVKPQTCFFYNLTPETFLFIKK